MRPPELQLLPPLSPGAASGSIHLRSVCGQSSSIGHKLDESEGAHWLSLEVGGAQVDRRVSGGGGGGGSGGGSSSCACGRHAHEAQARLLVLEFLQR